MTTQIEERLAEAGVFKGAHGLEGLANAADFWEKQPYGTRLYYGDGIADYLHRGVLDAAIKVLASASRTHPAEGGEGRDAVRKLANEWAMSRDYCVRNCANVLLNVLAAPPPQTVAPERGEAKAVALPDRRANPGQDDGEHTGWTDYEIGLAHGWNECLDAIAATPQPTPAPSASNEWRDAMVYLLARVGGDAPVFAGNGANPTPQELSDEIYSTVCHLEDRARNAPSALRYRDPTIEDARFVHDTYITEYSKPFPTYDEAMLTALKAGGFVVNAIGAKMAEGEG